MAVHRLKWFAALAGLMALAFADSDSARAHFRLDSNLRIIHVAHEAGGLRVYMRLPMPMVVAGLLGPETADGQPAPAPYTTNRIEDGVLTHMLDRAALARDPLGLGRLVAEGHVLWVAGAAITGRVEAVRVHPVIAQPRFTTLDEVRDAMAGPVPAEDGKELFVGEAVIDVRIFYPIDGLVTDYRFSATLAPAIEGAGALANLLIDHRDGAPRHYRATGTLAEPIAVSGGGVGDSRSWLAAAAGFVWQGVVHIWLGADHMLFVLCLTIGAFGLGNLLWRITGFTLGHTVTLIAGFLGYGPTGAWFIPTIEAAIAVSIIYAGVIALTRRPVAATFAVTAVIGLLHGFGFSFVLRDILQIDTPHLWSSLIAFNVGVEVGQVALILLVWPVMTVVEGISTVVARYGRGAVAVPCIAVALVWTVERVGLIWSRALS